MEYDAVYYYTLRDYIYKKWRGKTKDLNNPKVCKDKEKFVLHLKYYINWRSGLEKERAALWPVVEISDCYNYFRVWKLDKDNP